ncbi:MAG: hypothetical protein R3F34_03935 [Planctomycetota bacterium]
MQRTTTSTRGRSSRAIRTLAAAALALVFTGAVDVRSADASTATSVMSGRAKGSWELPPSFTTSGVLGGHFFDSSGSVMWDVDGEVVETQTSPPALALRIGYYFADLNDPTSTAAFPKYSVAGNWSALQLTGQGTFDGYMGVQFSPAGAVFLIGQVRGKFSDPPAIPGPGRFSAIWRADV